MQAYIINDDENHLIGSDGKSFQFLAYQLRTAVRSPLHLSATSYRTLELLTAIHKLAVSEDNLNHIIESKALDSYADLLEAHSTCSIDEQFSVAQGLWTLAANSPNSVRQHERCVNGMISTLHAPRNCSKKDERGEI